MLQEASLLALEERLASLDGDPDEQVVHEDLVVSRRHVVRALERTGPSLSPAQRERYASFGDDA